MIQKRQAALAARAPAPASTSESRPLTAEEKAAKLAQMTRDAAIHDEESRRRMAAAAAKASKEAQQDAVDMQIRTKRLAAGVAADVPAAVRNVDMDLSQRLQSLRGTKKFVDDD